MLDIKWNTSATDIHNYVNTIKSRTSIVHTTHCLWPEYYKVKDLTAVDVVGIMYISVSLLSNIVEILELGKEFADANKDNKITGFLIYQSPYFCQYIEGNKHAVNTLLTHISNDCRHVSMRIIENCTYTNRKYPEWDMEVMIYKKIGTSFL